MKSNEELWREVRRIQAKVEKEIAEEERMRNSWHTGTPAEEGYYLIHLKKYYCKDTCGYMVAKWERNWWRTINVGSYWNLEEEIDAWQKIEPYKEKEE